MCVTSDDSHSENDIFIKKTLKQLMLTNSSFG